mmetsp:Transcript_49423/g.73514  ORF Transcript_49423/g.73514 Transcript_49423/m.73514 type:complete len:113 (+) Transcript_49423:644-982(+)
MEMATSPARRLSLEEIWTNAVASWLSWASDQLETLSSKASRITSMDSAELSLWLQGIHASSLSFSSSRSPRNVLRSVVKCWLDVADEVPAIVGQAVFQGSLAKESRNGEQGH